LAEKLVQHLDRYLISEQVEIHDRTRDFGQLQLVGPESFSILEHGLGHFGVGLAELDQPVRALPLADLGYLRRNDALGLVGYDLVCRRERMVEVWQHLIHAGARPAGLEAYEVLRIEAGLPVYGKDIDESNLAPEIGRTAQAISWTKGCYLGQEPIVRIRNLGHVNRTLLGLKAGGDDPLAPGVRVLREGKEVGQVTSSVVSPALGVLALAYIRRGCEPGTTVEIETAGERRSAEVASLPFAGGSAG
jgi:folate-binding protein YgfZ